MDRKSVRISWVLNALHVTWELNPLNNLLLNKRITFIICQKRFQGSLRSISNIFINFNGFKSINDQRRQIKTGRTSIVGEQKQSIRKSGSLTSMTINKKCLFWTRHVRRSKSTRCPKTMPSDFLLFSDCCWNKLNFYRYLITR